MKNIIKIGIVGIGLSALLLTACHHGSAEKLGKKVDDTAEHISDTVQDKGPMQKAGEKVDELAH